MDFIKLICLIAIVGVGHFGWSQGEEAILWKSETKLTWKDFKGKVPPRPRAAATTASGISYQLATLLKNGELRTDFTVSTYFYPHKSWYRPLLCNALVLSHEQLHFDISELYARKMRRKLAATHFSHDNVKAVVRRIYGQITKELNDFQNRYDKETNFSRNSEQQLIWNKKIAVALIAE